MNTFELNSAEKQRLEEQHASTRDGKEKDRLKAILLFSEGWSAEMIGQALRLHQTTISRHLNEYHHGKLSSENGGSESKLSESQTEELIAHLTEQTYKSTESIIIYVNETYGVEYTVAGFNKWLHRNGFSYKKAKGRPYKADTEEQKKFIKKYNSLKASSDSKNPIIFMDSVHPTQATKLSYGWIRTGETKEVHTTASRTRMNIVGAINLKKLSKPIVTEFDTVNAESIIDFFHQIKKGYPKSKKIHLILDQAGYHKNKDVKKAAKKLKIKLHYLPPYSPNLNPIERLWKIMNEYARNNKFFKSAKDFKEAIYDFFKITVPKIKDELRSRITDNFQILKPASSS
jgi:transposase